MPHFTLQYAVNAHAALLSIEKALETGKRREFSSARAFARKQMGQLSASVIAILSAAVLLCACPAKARQPSTVPSPAQASGAETHNEAAEETVFCLTASSSTDLLDYKIVVKRLTTYLSGPYRVDFIQTPNGIPKVVYSVRENFHVDSAEILGTGCVAIVSVGRDGKAFTRVFRLEPQRIVSVLAIGGFTVPEFVDGFMLNYTGRIIKGNCLLPTKAQIYEWDGKTLNPVATAPYDDRFDALSRVARARAARNPTLPCCGVWIDCPGSQSPPRAAGQGIRESAQP
jgi:hypothetical protein